MTTLSQTLLEGITNAALAVSYKDGWQNADSCSELMIKRGKRIAASQLPLSLTKAYWMGVVDRVDGNPRQPPLLPP